MHSRNHAYRKCEWNNGESVEQKETLCDEEEIVGGFAYLGDIVNAGGGCEAAVTVRTRYG